MIETPTDRHLSLLWALGEGADFKEALQTEPGATYLELFDAAQLALNELEKRRHVRLFDALREWRRLKAMEQGVPAYVVFPDKALWAIAEAHPEDVEQLPTLWGVGEKTTSMYGEDVIEITRAYPEGDDVVDPLTLSVLQLLASGHGLWQVQEAYPGLEAEAIQEQLNRALSVLEFELPSKGSVDEGTDDDHTMEWKQTREPLDDNQERHSATVMEAPAGAIPYRKRQRRGRCSWLGCTQPLQKPYYTYCQTHYDTSERNALEAEYERADDQRKMRELLRRMGSQNYDDPT